MILCCKCGIEIEPNEKNICFRCLNNETNLIRGIKESMIIETCRGCERYLVPPSGWKSFSWGSQELLIFLLGRNKSIKGLQIIDSNFVYTEEHSQRMQIEITILKDGVQQNCTLRYTIKNMQCPNCMRSEAKQYWRAIVQLRQPNHHPRTFLFIEQLILKHKAHLATSNIKERKDGIDFYFLERTDAVALVSFITSYCGTKVVGSSRLISEDDSNNTANYKFTFSVEILPFCKDDLVYLGPKNSLGLGAYALVTKARSTITFLDPFSFKTNKLHASQYFANESAYKILMRSSNFKKYTVIYARLIDKNTTEATITDDGVNLIEVVTHLKIKDDDIVVGYSISNCNLAVDIDLRVDVILVRIYNNQTINWKLKTQKAINDEYRYFVDDIANDKEMLNNICVFDDKNELIDDMEALGL